MILWQIIAGITKQRVAALFLAGLLALLALLSGCVNQHPVDASGAGSGASGAPDTAPANVPWVEIDGLRIVATSMATVEIMDRLEAPLAGVPHSNLQSVPERYADVPEVGMAMSPDIEIIRALKPDYVFSPSSLKPDLQPKYEAAKLDYYFLDLKSVEGMYCSITEIGQLIGREAEAAALNEEYESWLSDYRAAHEDEEPVRALVLMGLPGSYIVATENSYVGSLVEMAGLENVYADEAEEFIAANTEDMALRDPDVILRAAHALPDDVVEMFAKEFEENDIWKHFRAVRNGRVYDLPYEQFGMSATFRYPKALETLGRMVYGG
jgi:iron complex transport system substrate-binding protein